MTLISVIYSFFILLSMISAIDFCYKELIRDIDESRNGWYFLFDYDLSFTSTFSLIYIIRLA